MEKQAESGPEGPCECHQDSHVLRMADNNWDFTWLCVSEASLSQRVDPTGIVSLEKEDKLGGVAATEESSASVTREGSQTERRGPRGNATELDAGSGEDSSSGLSTGLD